MRLLRSSYLAGSQVAKAAPAGVLDALVAAGGTAWFQLSRAQHEAALDNYAAVLELPRDHRDVRRVARRAFQNYGRMLVDFTKIASLTKAEVLDRVTHDGMAHLDRALERGRGLVLALPHMGSWDWAGAWAGVSGYDVHAVAETFPGSLNDAVVEAREYFGLKVIPLGRSAVPRLIKVLEGNGLAALMTDVSPAGGVEVEMFGRRISMASGPAALALRTGAAIIVVGVYSAGPSRYHLHVLPELIYEASGDRKRDVLDVTQRIAKAFEPLIRAHPDQWYAFKPILRPVAA